MLRITLEPKSRFHLQPQQDPHNWHKLNLAPPSYKPHLESTFQLTLPVALFYLSRKTKNIHLILGGHTHTFLEKPTEEKNLDGQTVLINQVGWAGLQVGRLDFEIDSNCFAKKDIIEIK